MPVMRWPSVLPLLWRHHAALLTLIGLTLVAYLSALNREQQALPWAIAALLSATLLTGIVLPHWLVRTLCVVRQGPQRAIEGERIEFRVEVENRGRLPRFMVELVDRLPFIGAARGEAPGEDVRLGLLAYVPGGAQRSFSVAVQCELRGRYQLGPAGLATRFPLGLVEARQPRSDSVQTLTIYPRLFSIVALPLHGSPLHVHRGNYLLPQSSGAAEFCGLREYRRGDNPRHVHWPTTARLNELMIKEFEPLASACLYIVLDQSSAANVGQGRESTFEYTVRIAASIARFACSNNIPTRLAGQGLQALHQPAGIGDTHFQALLDELAVVRADGSTAYAEVLRQVATDCQRGETVVAFLAEPRLRQTDTLRVLAGLRASGAHLLVIVFRRASFDEPGHRVVQQGTALASLQEMGAICVEVEAGDDLVRLFNP